MMQAELELDDIIPIQVANQLNAVRLRNISRLLTRSFHYIFIIQYAGSKRKKKEDKTKPYLDTK